MFYLIENVTQKNYQTGGQDRLVYDGNQLNKDYFFNHSLPLNFPNYILAF
jgi:hypothetical protein